MDDFSFSERPWRWWIRPLIFFSIGAVVIASYVWYNATRYPLPKLKPFAGAQEDLFAQIKCLRNLTENPEANQNDPTCRFRKTYESFWLTPRSLDSCMNFSTDNAVTAFESPKRLEFDFMCEGKAMRVKFYYRDGKYAMEGIGMTSP